MHAFPRFQQLSRSFQFAVADEDCSTTSSILQQLSSQRLLETLEQVDLELFTLGFQERVVARTLQEDFLEPFRPFPCFRERRVSWMAIVVTATATINGEVLNGASTPVPPVVGGTTDVGIIDLSVFPNGGFELGDLTGFTPGGAAFVIHSLGSQVAPEGQYMAYLNNGNGSLGNSLSKLTTTGCITPPQGPTTLAFAYNFLSSDYPPFDDAFKVIVTTSQGTQAVVVASVIANYLEILDASTGYQYMTGFKTATIDISNLVNGAAPCSLSIEFQVYDALDTIVDSAVLIDDIRFE